MKIEALCESRDPDRPAANEDCLVVAPGRGLAVFDGVTDRTGLRFEGQTSGRIASRAAADAFSAFLADGGGSADLLVARASAALRDVYARLGLLDDASVEKGRRFGTTLAAAWRRGTDWTFARVGDSGIRIDGVHLLQDETPVDRITSALRTEVVGHLVRAGADAVARAAVARACVLYGLGELHPGMAPWIDAAALGRLREASVARACSSFAAAPTAEIRALVERGVVGGQSAYANAVRPPLGYGVIDGFEVPSAFVRVETRAAASVNSIELFTDGYFRLAEAPSLAAWEAAADAVEREDSEKVGAYAAPKGSVGRIRTDDRTVVVATF